jgi:hypothetical protein
VNNIITTKFRQRQLQHSTLLAMLVPNTLIFTILSQEKIMNSCNLFKTNEMFDKLFALAVTGLLTASGTAVLSTLSIVSTPLTPSAQAQAQIQAQAPKLQPVVSGICQAGAPITPNCVPKNGDFRLMPPGFSIKKELPQPGPRPGSEVMPSTKIR